MTDRDKQIKMVCLKIVSAVDEYMDNHDGQKESEKLVFVMAALTRVLGTIAATMDVPLELMTKAIEADMRTAHEAMADKDELH